MKPVLVLASSSPRRRQLLALLGWEFQVLPANVDETVLPGEQPQDYVRRLAQEKAQSVVCRSDRQAFVVAADTTVVDRGEILGKPEDDRQARSMLLQLRGRSHQVLTSLAVTQQAGALSLVDLCETNVPMRLYSETEMEAYIASGDPLDKAGAYAIQHSGFHPVLEIRGCYANVVGLPLCHLMRSLRRAGLFPNTTVPQDCQRLLGYHCPVYEDILAS